MIGLRLDLNEEATILAVRIMTEKARQDQSRQAEATAFAPATVANVAVGFDVLGFALEGVGDRVRVSVDEDAIDAVTVESITGVVADLPTDPERNTAAVAVTKMIEALNLDVGLRIALDKGMPPGSGMGGRRPRPSERSSRPTDCWSSRFPSRHCFPSRSKARPPRAVRPTPTMPLHVSTAG